MSNGSDGIPQPQQRRLMPDAGQAPRTVASMRDPVGPPAVCCPTLPDWPGRVALVSVGLLVLGLTWFKLGNLDTGYHVAYGRHFLQGGGIVDRDPFIYPEHAVPFVNANWGSQVVMALVHAIGGANGLIGLRIVLLAIVFACIALVVRRFRTDSCGLWIAWAWLLAAMAGYERFSMRPELFSYAAMAVMLVVLSRGLGNWRSIAVLAAVQLAWVNLHSYFLVGPLMTGCWLVGQAAASLPGRRRAAVAAAPPHAGQHPSATSGSIRLLAVALVVQSAVCLVNPWHIRGAVFPLTTLRFLHGQDVMGGAMGDPSASAWSEISEFQSPFSFSGQIINARTIHAYYVLLAVAVVGLVSLAVRGRLGPALVVLLFMSMSFQMRRNIAQFAFMATPLAIGMLAAFAQRWLDAKEPRTSVRAVQRTGGDETTSKKATTSRWGLAGLTVAYAVLCLTSLASGRFYYVERRITRELGVGYSDRTFPEAAVRWLAAAESLQPRLFVDYFSSSNALLWLPEDVRLFVNTNTFACRDETLRTAFDVGLGRIPYTELFDRDGINVALLHAGPDTQMLIRSLATDATHWALVYVDSCAVVFVRRIPEHVPLILASEQSEQDLDAEAWIASMAGPRYAKALALGAKINVPMALGWSASAARLAEAAVDLAPDYAEAWHYLGVCHGNLGNQAGRDGRFQDAEREYLAAIDCFKKVTALSPNHSEAAAFLQRTQQALSLLRQAQPRQLPPT